jgi:hypothetical protein
MTMTETDLIEGLATLFRANVNEPLASCEVHTWPQIDYEGAAGYVELSFVSGREVFEAIGNQAADEVSLRIYAELKFADTEANRQSIETLCAQIRFILRTAANRRMSTDSGLATLNRDIRWEYGFNADGQVIKRYCTIWVTYRLPQGTSAP